MPTTHQILKEYWGYDSFRPLQEDIINSILAKQNTLALLPTGGGKSLCYQVPALMLKGVCVVISPLIALMQDQVARLKKLGIMAECINSSMHYSDVSRILSNTVNGDYDLLYVSPERLQTKLFNKYLPAINISLIAVDEAHCISQWGHDFRPSYLKIATLKEIFRNVPVLALTASATQLVQDDILTQLKLKNVQLFRESFERKNIFYDISYSENKNNAILDALNSNNTSTIIYCRSRRKTVELTNFLKQHNTSAITYHAGMDKEDRINAQNAWMDNHSKIIVATTAFGMGIDKADVGMVIHYDVPEHLEAYYQESGRAGRNGNPSKAILFFNQTDINRLEESLAIKYPATDYLRKVYQSVAEYLQIATGTEPNHYYDFDLVTFCQRFKLEALPAASALKLLEQEGLWTLTDAAYNPITVYIIADRSELVELAQHQTDLSYVLTNMLRLYGSLFQYPTPVRLNAIAHQAKMPLGLVEKALIQLHKMGYIEYNKPSGGTQLFFHHHRVDSKQLIINIKRIEELKRLHQQRTEAMVAFVQSTNICRNKILLRYFDEVIEHDCRHCDYCNKKYNNTSHTNYDLRKAIIDIASRQEKMPINTIIDTIPEAIKADIVALVRKLIEERVLTLNNDNTISPA